MMEKRNSVPQNCRAGRPFVKEIFRFRSAFGKVKHTTRSPGRLDERPYWSMICRFCLASSREYFLCITNGKSLRTARKFWKNISLVTAIRTDQPCWALRACVANTGQFTIRPGLGWLECTDWRTGANWAGIVVFT